MKNRLLAPSGRWTLAPFLGFIALSLTAAPAIAAIPEPPVTEAPSVLTATTATFNGVLNPGASTEKVSYRFFYAPGGECATSLMLPSESPFPEGEGNHQKVSLPVTGLEASTTYSVCLFAANPLEEGEAAFGSSVEFTTPASKPVIVTQTAASVTPFTANLQAEVSPENQSTTSCVFEYGKVVTESKLPCEQLELSGGAPETATRALAGLSPSTKYHFRVVVKNATGETKGAEQTFETAASEKPAITSETVSGIQPFQARLEASLNPNFQPTKCRFTYGVSVGEHTVGCEPELLEGFGEQPVGGTITGLEAETTYHYRVLAKNAAGETQGTEQEFTTLPLEAPIFVSENPATVTATDATLEARINPDAQETTYGFEYATDEAFTENVGTAPGAEPLPAVYEELTAGPVDLGGKLTPNTTYFYRVTATNPTGTLETAPIQEFTTSPAEPPIVSSESASSVTETGVTFKAQVNPNNHEATYDFEYATDEGFTKNVRTVPGTAALPAVNESLPAGPVTVSGLTAATVYYYRVVASNPVMGTADGPIQHFHTLSKPAVSVNAAETVGATSATITGTINPGGAQTTYALVYVRCSEGKCESANTESTSSRSLFATGYTPEAAAPITIEELTPGTTYHYTFEATNSTGTTIGLDHTFTTAPGPQPPTNTGPVTGAPPINTPTFTLPPVFAPLPFTSIAALNAKEAKENGQPIHSSKKKHTKKKHRKLKRKKA